jgi:hypothetical protein
LQTVEKKREKWKESGEKKRVKKKKARAGESPVMMNNITMNRKLRYDERS